MDEFGFEVEERVEVVLFGGGGEKGEKGGSQWLCRYGCLGHR